MLIWQLTYLNKSPFGQITYPGIKGRFSFSHFTALILTFCNGLIIPWGKCKLLKTLVQILNPKIPGTIFTFRVSSTLRKLLDYNELSLQYELFLQVETKYFANCSGLRFPHLRKILANRTWG